MTPKPFLDTIILIYALSGQDSRKDRAASLINRGGVVSIQVLNEFVNVARRKLRKEWPAIISALDDMALLLDPPLPLTVEIHRGAIDMSRRYGFGIDDSLILSTAKRAGCRLLYTEGLQHGQTVEGVLVRNPFALD